MIRSMTGYGRAQRAYDDRDITVEIKAVNHRYFELNTRMPRSCFSLEDAIRTELRRSIVRGKVDLNLTIRAVAGDEHQVSVDRDLLDRYLTLLRAVGEETGLKDDLTVSSVLRFPSVITEEEGETDAEQLWGEILPVLQEAAAAFVAQREAEGKRLADDIIEKCGQIKALTDQVEASLPAMMQAYEDRLRARMQELLGDREVDEGRLLTEVAIMADKTAVDEELVRLRSHSAALSELLESGVSNGKKMDFIIQEMNREVNTTTSKISDLSITRIAIELKAIIEKIREQIQNIE